MSNLVESQNPELRLVVLSLRYSSWSMRALLPLWHAGAPVRVETAELPLDRQGDPEPAEPSLAALNAERDRRRALGSVTGLFPVLWVGDTPVHEALAIGEWAAERFPEAGLWPDAPLARAQARSLSTEMASGFSHLRGKLSCHVTARVPGFAPDARTQLEIERVFELMRASLDASGGPLLFGRFGIVDAMYFPVLTRFDTYGVPLPEDLQAYAKAVWASPAVGAWRAAAREAPSLPVYDDYIRNLGGDPNAAPL